MKLAPAESETCTQYPISSRVQSAQPDSIRFNFKTAKAGGIQDLIKENKAKLQRRKMSIPLVRSLLHLENIDNPFICMTK
jgi:hypothetical protein